MIYKIIRKKKAKFNYKSNLTMNPKYVSKEEIKVKKIYI